MSRFGLGLALFVGMSTSALACSLSHPPGQHPIEKNTAATAVDYWPGPAISGAWFNPDRSGEGVIIEYLNDGRVLAIWFTYPAAGEAGDQAWLLAQEGVIEGNTLRFTHVVRPQGARFGAAFDPAQVSLTPWGTLQMQFNDCNQATLSWAGPASFGSGSRAMSRLTSVDEIDCAGTRKLTATGGRAAAGLRSRSGAWYVPSRSGEGWIVEELADGRTLVYWFTYDPEGRQAWTVGSAVRDGNRLVIEDNRIARGTRFGSGFNAGDVELRPWGRLEINFDTCNSAQLSYASTLPGYGSASRSAARLTSMASARCVDAVPTSITASFTERTRMATPYPSELAVAGLGDSLYALAGFRDVRGFRRYDRGSDTWTRLPDLPAGRDHAAAFAIPGSVYLIGGAANGSGNQSVHGFRFDIASSTWEPIPELLNIYGSHAAVANGQAFIGFGDGSLQQFDPRQRRVRRIDAPDFQQRDHSQVVAFMDEIWSIAGRTPETRTVAIYDPASERWRAGPSINNRRGGFAAAVAGDRIVIGGGEVIFTGTYVEPSVEIYNAGAAAWQLGPNLPVPVHGTAAAAINGRFVMVSGSTAAGTALGNTGRVFELSFP